MSSNTLENTSSFLAISSLAVSTKVIMVFKALIAFLGATV